jgi:hypothetical protein
MMQRKTSVGYEIAKKKERKPQKDNQEKMLFVHAGSKECYPE